MFPFAIEGEKEDDRREEAEEERGRRQLKAFCTGWTLDDPSQDTGPTLPLWREFARRDGSQLEASF